MPGSGFAKILRSNVQLKEDERKNWPRFDVIRLRVAPGKAPEDVLPEPLRSIVSINPTKVLEKIGSLRREPGLFANTHKKGSRGPFVR